MMGMNERNRTVMIRRKIYQNVPSLRTRIFISLVCVRLSLRSHIIMIRIMINKINNTNNNYYYYR